MTCIGFVLLRSEALSWKYFREKHCHGSAIVKTAKKLAGVECQEGGFMKWHFITFLVLLCVLESSSVYIIISVSTKNIPHFAAWHWILFQRSLRACANHMIMTLHAQPWI